MPYDVLAVAGGSHYSYFGRDDWREHAPELKTLDGALELRDRILLAFEAAEVEQDDAAREAWLTFVVVGAGTTGVEMAGQIAELARDVLPREYRDVDTRRARVLLVEAGDRVLPGVRRQAVRERGASAAVTRRDAAAREQGHGDRRGRDHARHGRADLRAHEDLGGRGCGVGARAAAGGRRGNGASTAPGGSPSSPT